MSKLSLRLRIDLYKQLNLPHLLFSKKILFFYHLDTPIICALS